MIRQFNYWTWCASRSDIRKLSKTRCTNVDNQLEISWLALRCKITTL